MLIIRSIPEGYLQKNEDVMKRRIAFFDFDGTITTKDSLLSFIFFQAWKIKDHTWANKHISFLCALYIEIIPAQKAKGKSVIGFFRNEPLKQFEC